MTSLVLTGSAACDTMAVLSRIYGTAGEELPYAFHTDNIITLLMLAGFVVIATAFGFMQRFIFLQLKTFFRVPRNDIGRSLLSDAEFRLQMLLATQTCVQIALLLYLENADWIIADGRFASPHTFTAIFFLAAVAYFLLRAILYIIVNGVFFDNREHKEWMRSMLFLMAIEGAMLYPITLLAVYLDLSSSALSLCVIAIVIMVKILTVCKLYAIFFRTLNGYLQFFVYLCTLEIVPFLAMWAGMESVKSILEITRYT